MNDSTIFSSETVDISLTGMCLKKGLPDGWQLPCSFTLMNESNKNLEVIATLVPTNNDSRTRYSFVRVPKLNELHSWLVSSSGKSSP
jgi:hypothetical protein